jgi:hypothetical protein
MEGHPVEVSFVGCVGEGGPFVGRFLSRTDDIHTVDVTHFNIGSEEIREYLKYANEGHVPEKFSLGILQLAIFLKDDDFIQKHGHLFDLKSVPDDLRLYSDQIKSLVLQFLLASIKKNRGFKVVTKKPSSKAWWSFSSCDPSEASEKKVTMKWRACLQEFVKHRLAKYFWEDSSSEVRNAIANSFGVTTKNISSCAKNDTVEKLAKWTSMKIEGPAHSSGDKEVKELAKKLYTDRVAHLRKFQPKSFFEEGESAQDVQHDTIMEECMREAKSRVAKKQNANAKKLDY